METKQIRAGGFEPRVPVAAPKPARKPKKTAASPPPPPVGEDESASQK